MSRYLKLVQAKDDLHKVLGTIEELMGSSKAYEVVTSIMYERGLIPATTSESISVYCELLKTLALELREVVEFTRVEQSMLREQELESIEEKIEKAVVVIGPVRSQFPCKFFSKDRKEKS